MYFTLSQLLRKQAVQIYPKRRNESSNWKTQKVINIDMVCLSMIMTLCSLMIDMPRFSFVFLVIRRLNFSAKCAIHGMKLQQY